MWAAYSGRTTTDKILAVTMPIALFVASGFEHSVANMFMVPLGILYWTTFRHLEGRKQRAEATEAVDAARATEVTPR